MQAGWEFNESSLRSTRVLFFFSGYLLSELPQGQMNITLNKRHGSAEEGRDHQILVTSMKIMQ
jgi:hypothetical protein